MSTSSVPHPSVSRNLPVESLPSLFHSLSNPNNSVLSLCADASHIFSGSQCPDISVWDKKSFAYKASLVGHSGSILTLEYAEDRRWLFSSSGDSTVRIWCTATLVPIYVLNPYLETDAGDLFSLAWNPILQTIYIGCQNTSLQWFRFRSNDDISKPELLCEPSASNPAGLSRKAHKFFDSYPQYERRPADINAMNGMATPPTATVDADGCVQHPSVPVPKAFLQVPAINVIDSAHYGYVYCMALLPSTREGSDDSAPVSGATQLVTGSGDETVKLWDCTPSGLALKHTFECSHGAVLALVTRGETVYAGCQDGYVKVWDLETKALVREIIVQEVHTVIYEIVFSTDGFDWRRVWRLLGPNGQIQRWSLSFDCTASWSAHNGIVLSSIVTLKEPEKFILISGANDGFINIWDISPPIRVQPDTTCNISSVDDRSTNDTMTYALSKFVSIPSVSSDPAHHEDCRQAAIWLKKCLSQLGAESTLLSTAKGVNPLVLATFCGTQGKHAKPRPRVLFYGHYDVISAPSEGWDSDPFSLSGRNGYLYGRGVTDNKGPIMAVACAAAELLGRRQLGLDLVFLIEGEEETGSNGFKDAVKRHKDSIGHIDGILVCNSTWIAEDPPCITYGLRGVVHSTIEISSSAPDLHSGIEGGAAAEPMLDMVSLLAKLLNGQRRVMIPKFYDHVRPQTEDETELYKLLSNITQRPASSLSSRWREPSLTVHNIEVSGPKNSTVIPGTVKSCVSIRIVPDQDLDSIAKSLIEHIKTSFQNLNSPNKLAVSIDHTADWWLGNLDDPWFKALEGAIQEEWGVDPLRIREGGSIPSVPYLEKEFGCHALHLPLGQSSDQAHLPNERMSLSNLCRGKSVIERFLLRAADTSPI